MKLDVKKTVIESGNLGETTTFGMEMNAKAFKMLTGTLYNDKIGSIVRELACNAVDAHTMAGNAHEPIVIHLPDAFEPYLTIQDFGVGMSDHDIRSIYTTLFKSTKDQSNDTVGAFGLGSKTPLSYTDNFNVTSVFDGVVRDYLVFVNDSGVPSITKVGERKTSDRNGVSVQVGIEQKDFNEVKRAVVEQLKFFDVRPKTINGTVLWHEFTNKVELGDLGFIADNSNGYYYVRYMYFVQGGVGYAIEVQKAGQWLTDDTSKDVFEVLRGSDIVINFEIGDFGVTVSREDIEIDDKVKNSFRTRFGAFAKQAKQFALDILDKDKKTMSVIEFVKTHNRSKFAILAGLDTASGLLNYLGSPKHLINPRHNDIYVTHREMFDADGAMNFTIDRMSFKSSRSSKVSRDVTYKHFDLDYFKATKFYFVDNTTRYVMKASYVVEQSGDTDIHVVKSKNGSVISDNEMKSFERIMTEMFGSGLEFVKLSSIELPKSVIQAKTYATAKYRVVLMSRARWSMRDWDKSNESLDDVENGIYVPVFNLEALGRSGCAVTLLHELVNSGLIEDKKIYAFNEKLTARLADDDAWVSVDDYVDGILAKHKLNKQLATYYRKKMAYNASDSTLNMVDDIILDNTDGFDALKAVRKMKNSWKREFGQNGKKWRVFEHFIDSTYGIPYRDAINTNAGDAVGALIDSEWVGYTDKFGLRNHIRVDRFSDDVEKAKLEKHIIQYVNCVK